MVSTPTTSNDTSQKPPGAAIVQTGDAPRVIVIVPVGASEPLPVSDALMRVVSPAYVPGGGVRSLNESVSVVVASTIVYGCASVSLVSFVSSSPALYDAVIV